MIRKLLIPCAILALTSCHVQHKTAVSKESFGGSFATADKAKATKSENVIAEPVIQNEETEYSDKSLVSAQLNNKQVQSEKHFNRAIKLFQKAKAPLTDSTNVNPRGRGAKTETASLLAFIFGLLALPTYGFLAPPALILGIIGLVKYNKNPEAYTSGSKAFAIVGIVLGILGTLLLGLIVFLLLIWGF